MPNSSQYFSEKVVVVTGAGSGIGRTLAIELAQAGAVLALNDINEATLKETSQLLAAFSGECSIHVADLSKAGQVQALATAVIRKHERVDILINNAGVALGRMKIMDMSSEEWEWIMGINFGGTLNCVRFFLPHLLQQENAHIVNLSSIFGVAAVQERAGYCASKFAVIGLTEALRQELWNTKVQVSIVLPGGIRTNLAYNAKGWKDQAQQQRGGKLLKEDSWTSPEIAAKTILKGIRNKKYRIRIGLDAKALDLIVRILPSWYGSIMNYFITRAERKQAKETAI
jgi:NAD(P)-dependent dehydrogenase (short-subunit alcohol dehydrogenase family)